MAHYNPDLYAHSELWDASISSIEHVCELQVSYSPPGHDVILAEVSRQSQRIRDGAIQTQQSMINPFPVGTVHYPVQPQSQFNTSVNHAYSMPIEPAMSTHQSSVSEASGPHPSAATSHRNGAELRPRGGPRLQLSVQPSQEFQSSKSRGYRRTEVQSLLLRLKGKSRERDWDDDNVNDRIPSGLQVGQGGSLGVSKGIPEALHGSTIGRTKRLILIVNPNMGSPRGIRFYVR